MDRWYFVKWCGVSRQWLWMKYCNWWSPFLLLCHGVRSRMEIVPMEYFCSISGPIINVRRLRVAFKPYHVKYKAVWNVYWNKCMSCIAAWSTLARRRKNTNRLWSHGWHVNPMNVHEFGLDSNLLLNTLRIIAVSLCYPGFVRDKISPAENAAGAHLSGYLNK